MAVKISWRQALAWRMQRHLLDPVGTLPVTHVVRRLCGVQAQVASSAELVVRVRREASRPGEVGRALSQGAPHQDLGDAGCAPPALTEGGWSLPFADGLRAIV